MRQGCFAVGSLLVVGLFLQHLDEIVRVLRVVLSYPGVSNGLDGLVLGRVGADEHYAVPVSSVEFTREHQVGDEIALSRLYAALDDP